MNLFYPEAEHWMWDSPHCINLGEFEYDGRQYDLGVYVNPSTSEVSHAIVYGNEPGDYLSGYITAFKTRESCKENIRRWNEYLSRNPNALEEKPWL